VLDDAGAPLIAQTISVTERRGCAVTPAGAAWCWDWSGQATLVDPAGVAAVAIGLDHDCVVHGNGKVVCEGENLNAQSGDLETARRCPDRPCLVEPTEVDAPSATTVAVGARHSCAATEDGLWCWGSNEWGQLGRDDAFLVGAPGRVRGLGQVVEVIGGRGHTCARGVAGTLWCWGLDLTVMTCPDH
jgi:alpha-tubulin suppressor-like RCC1 family protein